MNGLAFGINTSMSYKRMDKENVVHLHNSILHGIKKNNDILKFVVKWMDLENIILSEGTQTQKDKYHITNS